MAGPEKASPFHSIRLTSSSNRNAIKAYVHSEQVVMAGSTLKMRLGEDAYTDNGVFIPKNSPVYGIVTGIDGERMSRLPISIFQATSCRSRSRYIPKDALLVILCTR